MTTENSYEILTVQAGADLDGDGVKFKAITLNGTVAASVNLSGGILRHGAKNGGHVSLVKRGQTKVIAGGAVNTVGFPLTVTTSGFIIAASSGGASAGRFLDTCASGDLVRAHVDFENIGFWRG
jgi:hypothetical protein